MKPYTYYEETYPATIDQSLSLSCSPNPTHCTGICIIPLKVCQRNNMDRVLGATHKNILHLS